MKKLVIVESPSKSKTIKQYLGDDYEVLSSKGHIRDLSISNVGGLGLDIENNFTPKYDVIKDKEKIVKDLTKAAKKAEEIYLATDPDREGEAISWHLEQVLNIKDKPTFRVIFNEVTKQAVNDAFKHPRSIDLALVSSQETRRILDRIIGFKLSKLLQNKIKSKSAGRVQSAALKILVDREKEISVFNEEEYWKIKAIFEQFEAELSNIDKKKAVLNNEEEAQSLLDTLSLEFTVDSVKERQRKRASKPPFTTSSLQQEASNKLNYSGQKTMLIAQKLYEGLDIGNETVGLITYMRTDSTRLSDTFIGPTKSYIKNKYGEAYVGTKKVKTLSKGAQDAHEGIRPTSIEYTPERVKAYLNRDEYRLYKMIYLRTVASLMRSARFTSTTVRLSNANTIFKARAQALNFDGYLKAYGAYESLEVSELPTFIEGATIKALNFEKTQHFTQPPARFTEAKLIKEMEDLGIGRPSTYSQTISTLKTRKYVKLEDKKFTPTEQGMLTIEKLDEYFSRIISVDYTAKMETVLDDIAKNEADQTKIVSDFYNTFVPLVEKANKEMEKEPPKFTGEDCIKCGKPMVFRESRYGTFEACSGFPECKYIKTQDKPEKKTEDTGITCPKCGKGKIVERIAMKGKNKGNSFYACNNFPRCKHILSGKPVGRNCPKCNNLLIEDQDGQVKCDDTKNCGHIET
ncbi:type I DNA topoisomerase [Liberiplasma polymorphum]|uniref:type I DNA topoisomerase n=1 Tax=Liberiplasma polymorphum TaxID=3374570 RepID=UPI003772ADE2